MYQPKHITDGSPAKVLMRWNGVKIDGEYRYSYYAYFKSREDALEYYENLIKPFWSVDYKWEIIDLPIKP